MSNYIDEEDFRPIKIILVGSSGVGKTSLINSFFDQPDPNQTVPTVAPAFCSTQIKLENGQKVELHVWDTAGQERFQSIGQMFYRDSDIAFVCFDKSSENTIPDWIQKVHDQVSTCKIFLVLTKSDLYDEEEKLKKKLEIEEFKKLYNANNYFLTSSTSGEGVKNLFKEAAKITID